MPRRSAPVHTPDAAIDIPLDGEERVIRKNPTGGFFRKKSDNIKSPDELLAGGSAAETKIAAPVSPAAAPSAPVKPVTVEADDFDLPPFDTASSAPTPVVPAPAPVMHTPFAVPTPSVQSAPVAAAAAATTVPAVLTDKQEDKLRRAEVDAAREEVTREIEGSDAQPQPPAYQYPPITLLKEGSVTNAAEAGAELRNNSRRLAQTLTSFGVDAQPGDVVRGPSVTRYEFTLSQGVKLSKITNLQDDIALALGVVLFNFRRLPEVVELIVANAFGWEQAMGGGVGAALMQGIKRGLFSNEAGMGSAPNVAATAHVSHPVKQGLIQTLGVFTDTLVICTCTAFIILFGGVPDASLSGIRLTQAALVSEIGPVGSVFVAVAIFLFAFSSIIGNYYYGEANIRFITRRPGALTLYRLLVGAMVLFGALATLDLAWSLADITMALMTLFNLAAILLLGRQAFLLLADYVAQKRQGIKNPVYTRDRIPELKDKAECW